jgi:hypothetical protein
MSKPIVITLPHSLGADTAKRRVEERLDLLRRDYIEKIAHSEVSWTGNKADIRVVALGQTTTAQLEVMADSLRIEVQLPWFLATLANKIQHKLTTSAEDTLKLGKPKS